MIDLKSLKLRTKLIGSFVLVAAIAGIISYVGLQPALAKINEDAIPTVRITGQIGRLVESLRAETVEYVAVGEEETVEELGETVRELETLVKQLQHGLPKDPGESAAYENLAGLTNQLTTLSSEIVQSHRQTMEELKALEAIEEKIDLTFDQAYRTVDAEIVRNFAERELEEIETDSIPTQRYLSEFIDGTRQLHLEALGFVASGEAEDLQNFEEARTRLEAVREKLEPVLEADEPGEAELAKQMDNLEAKLNAAGQNILAKHARTLSLLEQLEGLERQLEETMDLAQVLANEDVRLGVAQADQYAIAFSGAILLLSALLGLLLSNAITRPIYRLVEAARQIGAGDLTMRPEVDTKDEIGELARTFNSMTDQLRLSFDTLEDHVLERTHALETSVDFSGQLIAIRDLDDLLPYVVNRLQAEFNFYHVHIYLLEEETGDLVMVEGSGEVGRQLKEKGHRLAAGQGIVGTVAGTHEPFLSNNVDGLLNFVRNPLLPDTKSEMAVPLRKGDEVLGVLDIQSEQLDRFSPSDQALMQSIADQTALAVDNARLLTETQAALKQVERLNRRLTGEAWEEVAAEMPTIGYRFNDGLSTPLTPDSQLWLPPMKQAEVKRQLVRQVNPGNGEPPQAEIGVPLMLRGQVIGTLGIKREEAADWSQDELTAVESVANQITLALENARLSEEQQKTIGQLKDVDRLKSEFLTSMSHELRTPLNSIIGFADVIIQGIDGDVPEMALNDVKLIHNSGQHLLALINDILDLSKIEAGKMELVREPLNITDAFNEVLSASSALLKDKPVEAVVEAAATLPPIYADKLRFNQVLLNLVSNAAKFTEAGSITLKAEIRDQAPGQMFISVTDTGIGIAPDKLETIFDRFRQADSSTTRKYGGTGLGLPICKQLVEMHGGEIGVTSEEYKGSTFYFSVLLADETVAIEG